MTIATSTLHAAKWWEHDEDGKILCTLCPRYCHIGQGQAGFCFIRKNIDNKLYSLGYGRSTGFAIDPVEKKPLNHFLPGTGILSFGTAGCNLGCKFCQNWNISKARLDQKQSAVLTPEAVVQLAIDNNCPSIAFTYNDPVIWGEYVVDISRIAREVGIKSVMVTAGYITESARPDVYQYIDATNVDLKAFTERFYYKVTLSHLENVLNTLLWLRRDTDVWFEITNLLIPDENDDIKEIKQMCAWILDNLGDEVPLHFTAFHPDFKMLDKPRTPSTTLTQARAIALESGIKYVYVGNVHDVEGQSTRCPSCGTLLIQRDWHTVLINHMTDDQCTQCGHTIVGHFATGLPVPGSPIKISACQLSREGTNNKAFMPRS